MVQKITAAWLLNNYNGQAVAVAGCYFRLLGAGKDADTVLEDLRRYCFIYDSTEAHDRTGAVDPIKMATNEGRRQVFQHLVQVLGITEADLKIERKIDDGRDDARNPDATVGSPRYPDSGDYVDGRSVGPDGDQQ